MTPTDRVRTRMRRKEIRLWEKLDASTFSTIEPGARPRHATDALLIGVSAVLVIVLIAFRTIGWDIDATLWSLPGWIDWLARAAAVIGFIAGPAVMLALAIGFRHFVLLRDVVIAAALQLVLTMALADLSMPALLLLLSVATLATATPYLTASGVRAWSLMTWLGVLGWSAVWGQSWVGVGICVALGMATAAVTRLALGAPLPGQQLARVPGLAAELGVTVTDPRGLLATTQTPAATDSESELTSLRRELGRDERWRGWDGQDILATGDDGAPLLVTVFTRDAAQGKLLSAMWARFWYRGADTAWNLNRRQLLQHRASVLVWAKEGGVRAPVLVAGGLAGAADDAVLITRRPAGVAMWSLPDDALPDSERLGRAVWEQVNALHAAGLSHGAISPLTLNLDVADGAVSLSGFHQADILVEDRARAQDRAATLVSLARLVGVDAAVASSVANVDRDSLTDLLPLLQNSALPKVLRTPHKSFKPSRRAAGGAPKEKPENVVVATRAALSTALGVEEPKLVPLRRFSWSGFAMFVGLFIGVWMLAGQFAGLGDIGATLSGANWAWVVVAAATMAGMIVSQAWSLSGAVLPRMRLGFMIMLQNTNYFTGLIGGTVASTASTVRFFQRQGIPPATAVTSGVVASIAGFICQAVLSLVSIVFVYSMFTLPEPAANTSTDSGSSLWVWVLLAVVAITVLVGLFMAIPRWRSLAKAKLMPPVATAWGDFKAVASEPRHLLALFGGGIGTQVFSALCLWASLEAFGVRVPLPALLVITTAASLFGGIAPVPGGIGVIEAALIAGLTAVGVDPSTATAATLVYRLLTCYLPPIWGYPSMIWLRKRDLM